MPRLFTGIVLPDSVRQHLAFLRSPLPGAKWIQADNLHLTLRFAGDIDNRQAEDFADALNQIDTPPLDLSLSGLGIFGGKTPTSLWAGVAPSPDLTALAHKHERAARQAGLAPVSRKFTAHVTLARLKRCKAAPIARYLQHNGAFLTPSFHVSDFVLFSARPLVGGGPYVIEQTFPLHHAAPRQSFETVPQVS